MLVMFCVVRVVHLVVPQNSLATEQGIVVDLHFPGFKSLVASNLATSTRVKLDWTVWQSALSFALHVLSLRSAVSSASVAVATIWNGPWDTLLMTPSTL